MNRLLACRTAVALLTALQLGCERAPKPGPQLETRAERAIADGGAPLGIPVWTRCISCGGQIPGMPHAMARGPLGTAILSPGPLGGTWAFDPETGLSGGWSSLGSGTLSGLPGSIQPGGGHGMAHHAGADATLLFGGEKEPGTLNPPDLYVLNAAQPGSPGAPAWKAYQFANAPIERRRHAMAYDGDNSIVVFGGIGVAGTLLGDTYILTWSGGSSWSSKKWDQPGETPASRSDAAMALEPGTGKLLLLGGRVPAGIQTKTLADTWEFDVANGWTELCPSLCGSGTIHSAAMASDTHRDVVLAFGGDSNLQADACSARVLEWDRQSNAWKSIACDSTNPEGPVLQGKRVAAAYDPARGRTIVTVETPGTAPTQVETWFFTMLATECTDSNDCNGGQKCALAEGICCDGVCDQTCEACDGDSGECETVEAGAWPSIKGPCTQGADLACGTYYCDGELNRCTLKDDGKMCRTDSCVDAVFTAGAHCNDHGICAPEKKDVGCNGYLCEPDGTRCATSCDGACAPDYCCIEGACKFCAPKCADGGNNVVYVDGGSQSCGSYACISGDCRTSCTANADCAPEHVCVKGGVCKRLFDDAPGDDPCSCRVVGRRSTQPLGPYLMLAAALAWRARRRHREKDASRS